MQTNRYGDVLGSFPEKLAAAEEVVTELRAAKARGDADGMIVMACRLRIAMDLVERVAIVASIDQPDQCDVINDGLRRLQTVAYPLVEHLRTDGPILVRRCLSHLTLRNPLAQFRRSDGVIVASYQTIKQVTLVKADLRGARFIGAKICDAEAHCAVLAEIQAESAVLARMNATEANVYAGNLSWSLVEAVDFSRANLERVDWSNANVFDSSFTGAAMADTILADAMFVECDFRGADLRVLNLGRRATTLGARFTRCDLRASNWHGRDLTGVAFIDCRMHDVFGQAAAADAEIVRPDLSVRGDGSLIGSASSVIAAWQRA